MLSCHKRKRVNKYTKKTQRKSLNLFKKKVYAFGSMTNRQKDNTVYRLVANLSKESLISDSVPSFNTSRESYISSKALWTDGGGTM